MIQKSLIAVATAGALAAAITMPTKAEAYPAWVIPAIIAAGVGGIVIGGSALAASPDYYGQAYRGGSVHVRPSGAPSRCYIARERIRGGWQRVRVCD